MDLLDVKGYARLSMRVNKSYNPKLAHRLSYIEYVGPIRKGLNVLHKCDVPACVNPDHLFIGTQKANIRDMIRKGRDNSQATRNRQKTHCNAGHELSGDNLRIEGKVKARRCKKCESIKKARYYKERLSNEARTN